MPHATNDTHVSPKERLRVAFSSWDLVIPAAIWSVASVLLFLAFQPETSDQNSGRFSPDSQTTTRPLRKQQRTAEVAATLLRQDHVSLPTARACLARLATLQKESASRVCLQIIEDLPNRLSAKAEQRWTALIQEHVDLETLEAFIQNRINQNGINQHSVTQKSQGQQFKHVQLAWAAMLIKATDQTAEIFERAANDEGDMRNLLEAVPIVVNAKVSEQCYLEIQNWIFAPAVQNPGAINHQLVLDAMRCVAKIQIDRSKKVSTFCELAISRICPTECFAALRKLGAKSIPIQQQGLVAAAVLEYLADQNKHQRSIPCVTTWQFAESLTDVFSGDKRKRFEERLLEIRYARIQIKKSHKPAPPQAAAHIR